MIFLKINELAGNNRIKQSNNFKNLKILDGFNLSPSNIDRSPYICSTPELSINYIFMKMFPTISQMYNLHTKNHLNINEKMNKERFLNKKIETMDYKHLQMLFKFFFFLSSSMYIRRAFFSKSEFKKIKKIKHLNDLILKKHKEQILENFIENLDYFNMFANSFLDNENKKKTKKTKMTIFYYYHVAKKLINHSIPNFEMNNEDKKVNLSDFFRNSSFNPLGEMLGLEYQKYIIYLLKDKSKYMERVIHDYIRKNKRFKFGEIYSSYMILVDGLIRNRNCKCPDLFLIVNDKFLIPIDIKINPRSKLLFKDSQISKNNVKKLIFKIDMLKRVFR